MLPFEFQIVPNGAEGRHAESDVRRVLPMMRDRRVRIIHRAEPMHEGRRTERRLARISEIKVAGKIMRKLLRIRNR